MALRQTLSHVLSPNLYRVTASTCFGGLCQRRCISMATYLKVNDETMRLSHGVNGHSLSHLNKFHWSSLLRSEELRDTKWITEKYGEECVIIPITLGQKVKFWRLIRNMSAISKELGVGYSVNIEGKSKAEVSLYGKSTEEVEKAGKALVEKMEEQAKRKEDFLKNTVLVDFPEYKSPAITLEEVLRFLKDTRGQEIIDIEDKLGCKIYVRCQNTNVLGIDVKCDDAEKRLEAIKQVRTLFKDAKKRLGSYKYLSFSLPKEMFKGHNVGLVCQAIAKDWGKDLSLRLELGVSSSITIRAPSMELADEFKKYLMENVEKKIEEFFQNSHKEVIEVPLLHTKKFLKIVLPKIIGQHMAENLQYQIGRGDRSTYECVIYGNDPAEVQKFAEQIKLIISSTLTMAKSRGGQQKAEGGQQKAEGGQQKAEGIID